MRQQYIRNEIIEWIYKQNLEYPIIAEDILGFRHWVKWNGFREKHKAYDFAAYINDNAIILGLPPDTPVHSIAEGIVRPSGGYSEMGPAHGRVLIEHDGLEKCLISGYYHVVPKVEIGERVEKGQEIATLYKAPGNEKGPLVHLHFEISTDRNYLETQLGGEIDPSLVFDRLVDLIAQPQVSDSFSLPRPYHNLHLQIANFKRLEIWDFLGV